MNYTQEQIKFACSRIRNQVKDIRGLYEAHRWIGILLRELGPSNSIHNAKLVLSAFINKEEDKFRWIRHDRTKKLIQNEKSNEKKRRRKMTEVQQHVFPSDGIILKSAYGRKGRDTQSVASQWLGGLDMKIINGPYCNIGDRAVLLDQFGKIYLQGETLSGEIFWIEG